VFFEDPSIAAMAQWIDHYHHDVSMAELPSAFYAEDAISLSQTWFRPALSSPSSDYQAILLTGATGFLGAHLLYELLQATRAKIYCLIRAKTLNHAWEKLHKQMAKYHLDLGIDLHQRIICVLGDLSEPYLGIHPEIFAALSRELNAIYHNGALVNHIYDYESLKKTNIESTLEILRLATLHTAKDIHYISTIGTAVTEAGITENFVHEDSQPTDPNNGYLQTKWVCERLLTQAHEQGIHVRIYRPSWISGQQQTGICEVENNHFFRFIKACIQLGYAPNKNITFDILPVNFISRAIIGCSLYQEPPCHVFNFTNPVPLNWLTLIAWLRAEGYKLSMLSAELWIKKCFIHVKKEHALYPFASLYVHQNGGLLNTQNMPIIECTHTTQVLQALHLSYPVIDAALLKIYFNYLRQIHFIEAHAVSYA
jgi:thioester reductase-like protein